MRYEIIGQISPIINITLNAGEQIRTQKGAMICMDGTIRMDTEVGDVGKAFQRYLTKENIFLNIFTAEKHNSQISLSATFPGEILDIEMDGDIAIMAQQTAFLASTTNIDVSVGFTKNLGAAFFGGESFMLQKIQGDGIVFLETAGNVVTRELDDGEVLYVDTSNLVAFTEDVAFEVQASRGFKNILFGGEGLFLTKMTGPGFVWVQSVTLDEFAERLQPYLKTIQVQTPPNSQNSSSGGVSLKTLMDMARRD